MEKRYLVTGSWTDKTTGKPKSGIAEITGGVSKHNNQPFEFANTDSREEPIDGAYAVGTILTATVNLSVQENPSKVPESRNLKINPQQ